MVNLDIFLMGLMITSTLTGLATEAVKTVLAEHNHPYHANTLAGLVSLVLSVAVSAGYIVITNTTVTSQIAVYIIAMVFLSWLGSMVGYDKVIQAIGQFKTNKEEE